MNPKHHPPRHRQHGFTLVEIMVVIVIIGLLASIVGANVFGARDVAEIGTTRANIKQIADAVEIYMMSNSTRKVPSLEDLQTEDRNGQKWLQSDPQDPWGNDYVIREGERPGKFVVISFGPNGTDDNGGEDDITSDNLSNRKQD